MNWATIRFVIFVLAALVSRESVFAQDTELRDLDVSHWFCLSKPAGIATKPDEQERNLMKNRNSPGTLPLNLEQLDYHLLPEEGRCLRRGAQGRAPFDLDQAREQHRWLRKSDRLADWLVSPRYAGLAESTNCNDATFHDWHLEVFAQSSDHPPQVVIPLRLFAK